MKWTKLVAAYLAGGASVIALFRPRKPVKPLNANSVVYTVDTADADTVLAVGIGEHGTYKPLRIPRREGRAYEDLFETNEFLSCHALVVTDGVNVLFGGNKP